MKHLLVTGGAGFIGSNFIRYMLKKNEYTITNIDALTYAGKDTNLIDIADNSHYRFIKVDIRDKEALNDVFHTSYDAIIHFAAETHVDRSIENAAPFLETNVLGTYHLLEFLKEGRVKKFIYISTDEVYGSLKSTEAGFTENSPLRPNNPYAVSKSSGDMFTLSYFKTYKLPVVVTRCSNNYGPYQHEEKFLPKVILHALQNKEIPVYGTGENIRDWLYVEDHCKAIREILENGAIGEVYNIGGSNELSNITVVKKVLDFLGKPKSLITFVEDRKGHDFRYAINWSKLNTHTGWKPGITFEEGIKRTMEWFQKR